MNDDETVCEVLANNLSLPHSPSIFGIRAMVNDATHLYIYTYDQSVGGSIKKIPKTMGTVETIVSNIGRLNGLAIDDSFIYWLEYEIGSANGKIMKSTKDGSQITTLAEGFPPLQGGGISTYNVFFPNGIALNDTHVFWGEEVDAGAIRKVFKEGGAVIDLRRGDGFILVELEADNQFVYAINSNVSEILKISIGTGSSTVLNTSGFSAAGAFSNLELEANDLYWSEITENAKVFTLSTNGGDVQSVASGLTSPRSVYSRGGFLYVASSDGIFKFDLQLKTEEEIVCSNSAIPFTMNLDQSYVYLSDLPNGSTLGSKVVRTEN